jgi:FG-GAP repeat
LDGDGRSDLAVGTGTGGAGAVSLYLAAAGGAPAPGPVLIQGGGLAGTPEVADLAGAALA